MEPNWTELRAGLAEFAAEKFAYDEDADIVIGTRPPLLACVVVLVGAKVIGLRKFCLSAKAFDGAAL